MKRLLGNFLLAIPPRNAQIVTQQRDGCNMQVMPAMRSFDRKRKQFLRRDDARRQPCSCTKRPIAFQAGRLAV
jgi:hypothetical protein